MRVQTLAADGWDIGLAPECGGSLAHCRFHGEDVLRPARGRTASDADAGALDPLQLACFPLVPFSNRIAHGTFSFDCTRVRLAPNMRGEPHCLHGQGWRRSWDIERVGMNRCVMTFTHEAGEWPWSYSARQTISCQGTSLTVELQLTNDSGRPMPTGLGLHPYFPTAADCVLHTSVGGMWHRDASGLPVAHTAAPAILTAAGGTPVSALDFDHCFTGWSREARIEWPSRGLVVHLEASPTLRFVVLYAPAGAPFFCIEPVSHMTDAFNARAGVVDSGMAILPPAATLRAWMRLMAHLRDRRRRDTAR